MCRGVHWIAISDIILYLSSVEISNATEFTVQNKNSVMRVLANGILHIKYPMGAEINTLDIQDIQKGYAALPDTKPMKVLQELGMHVNMTNKARKYAAENSPHLLGVAYVIKGLAQRLLIRFYVRMLKKDKPTAVFNNFDDALVWLLSI
ncbi:MAG: hypothetical protein QMB65_12385 [Vicingaceae bacterium]